MAGQFDCPRCGTRLPATAAPGRCPHCRTELHAPPGRAAGPVATAARPAPPLPAAIASGLVGQLIDGRYRVVRTIGKGGYGVVYQAIDERTKRDVAVKMLLEKALDSPEAVARFQREAEVLLKIVHPNVLPVFDTGRHGACHYIAMSYVAGKSLRELIPATGFADVRWAVRLAATLAETLHYVYDRHKILHRDVKPANLMLADGDANALYLMDFGLAVCQDPDQARLTVDKSMMGTPAYMSPEQVRGVIAGIDHPTDIYSAGVTLYHMLTGKVPFTASGFEIYVEITTADPPPPSAHRRDIDPALDRIVLKALAKNPADRYPTGKDFATALTLWLGAQSGVQRLPPPRAVPFPTAGRDTLGHTATARTPLPPAARPSGRFSPVRPHATPASWMPAASRQHDPRRQKQVAAVVAIALLAAVLVGLVVVAARPASGPSPPPTTESRVWQK